MMVLGLLGLLGGGWFLFGRMGMAIGVAVILGFSSPCLVSSGQV